MAKASGRSADPVTIYIALPDTTAPIFWSENRRLDAEDKPQEKAREPPRGGVVLLPAVAELRAATCP